MKLSSPQRSQNESSYYVSYIILLSLGGEETEKEVVTGLSLRQFEESQLVGLQILLL